ncbi:alpha-amylase family glycosyl hydrolase [uncultured Arcticibacterium sp.]|uniref:alpha-amylase family glycosyl hydrolase n=1 Tax=uncultured Arcticibacterium sp. TaxID=2173042 RepID=UPI0030F77A4B
MTQNVSGKKSDKLTFYQIFTRLFGNSNTTNKYYGSIQENGVGKLADINKNALKSLKKLGISHVWYTGVIEHATMTDYSSYGIKKDNPLVVKGKAGSPYAIKDYYDIDPDLVTDVKNRMAEFENLVKRTHEEDLKVIIDFIPNHVAREYKSDVTRDGVLNFGEDDDPSKGFLPQNNFYYLPGREFKVPSEVKSPIKIDEPYIEKPALATGNDVFSEAPSINDWFETIKLNYGVDYQNGHTSHFDPIPDTWLKMRDILLYWSKKGVDGFRCDMAHMVPVPFWTWVIKEVKKDFPDMLFIAEIYDVGLYHDFIFKGGFDYLYDKVGLYDALRRLMEGHGNANDITKVWQNESGEYANHMLRFLENHDEQRITSQQFAKDAKIGLPAMALSAYLHDGPLMLYFGQEIGLKPNGAEGFQSDDGRTSIFDYWGLDEMARWNNEGKWNLSKLTKEEKELRKAYTVINETATSNEAINAGKFFDLQYVNIGNPAYNDTKVYSFLRYTASQKLLFVFNFDLNNSYNFKLKLPKLALGMMGVQEKEISLKGLKQINKPIKSQKISGLADTEININISENSWQVFEIK